MESKKYTSDFLIIGSGIAGLSLAIKASEKGTVNIVTKNKGFVSSTNRAQGGIASVLAPSDSFENHIADTLRAGAGLNNKKAVELLVHEGPDAIEELINWGAHFTYSESGKELDLGREGGHSHNRIVHARDLTGQEIERALLARVSEIDSIKVFQDHTAIDLLTEHQLKMKREKTHCYGAYILDNNTGVVNTFNAKITVLATGGTGQVYLHTTNPEVATGDGIAMAYRAGALIADMEFIQFHPTSFYQKDEQGPAFLISEAVRGEGAILYNSRGERFMEHLHPRKELAPRDIVARAIDGELKRLGDNYVLLDISFKGKEFIQKRFPTIYEHCLEKGIDIAKEAIPVVPAAHYLCGGIISDLNGKTTIENLYVSGEASCTGVHGANRLASNSLLEGLVFSNRTFLHASEFIENEGDDMVIPYYPFWNKEGTFDMEEWILIQHNMDDVKRLMWDYVGIIRTDLRLERAYRRILLLAEEIHDYYQRSTVTTRIVELRNLATVAKLIIKSAMARDDSIGLHYNSNHPDANDPSGHVIQHSGYEPEIEIKS